MGSHFITIPPGNLSKYMLSSFVGTLFYQLSLTFSKVSILFLYIRVFQFHWACRAAWVMLAIVVLYNTWGFFSTMTLCVPLQKYWEPATEGSCKPQVYMWAVLGLHVATDFLIFLIPVPVVLSMKALSRRQRMGLLLIFALGFFVCLISILRIVWIKQLYYSIDFTWDYVSINYWNCIEVNGAILIPCLVVLKPLARKFWPGFSSSSHEPISAFEAGVNGAGGRQQNGVHMVDLESHGKLEGAVEKPESVYVPSRSEAGSCSQTGK